MVAFPEKKEPGASPLSGIDLSEARWAARAWSATIGEQLRIERAAAFARIALETYAKVTVPSLSLSSLRDCSSEPLQPEASALAGRIGLDAASLPPVTALHYLTSLYPALLPEKHRGAIGAFYTPPCLSARLFDLASEAGLDWSKARVLDPAAGGGAFLVQAALRMRDALPASEPAFVLAQIGARLSGLEIDLHAAELAQAALEIALADLLLTSGRNLPSIVRVCDTLDAQPVAKFDLVAGNPPYGRVALTPAQRKRFARSLYGHANLYGVFTDVALRWTRATGLVAFLTPTSFLSGRYYSALRKLLANEAPPIAMDFVHARKGVFEDVLQETMLAVYRKGQTAGRAQVHYLHVAGEREASITRNGTIGLPNDPARPWLAPRSEAHSALIARIEGMRSRLRDWGYSVSTGPLVWNRFKRQLCDGPAGKAVYPLIWAECITTDGRFIFRAEKKNHSPFFRLRTGDDWLLVKEPCVLVQRTTAKEQARRIIAAELPAHLIGTYGGVVVENHLNMVRRARGAKVTPGVVAAILNSGVVDQIFRCMNGSVAVSAFELGALPLPDASALEHLNHLVTKGASREQIEAECERLYGLID